MNSNSKCKMIFLRVKFMKMFLLFLIFIVFNKSVHAAPTKPSASNISGNQKTNWFISSSPASGSTYYVNEPISSTSKDYYNQHLNDALDIMKKHALQSKPQSSSSLPFNLNDKLQSKGLYKCDVKSCNAICRSHGALEDHKKRIHGDNLASRSGYKCDEKSCRVVCFSKQQLEDHKYRIHSGNDASSYKCDKCLKKLSSSKSLKRHKKIC